MLKFFRGTGPGVMLFIVVLATGLWVFPCVNAGRAIVFQGREAPILYQMLMNIAGIDRPFSAIIAFCMVMTIATLLTVFNTNTLFIGERTFLPALLYIFLTSLVPEYQYLSQVIPAALLLHLAIIRITGSYRQGGTAFCFFDAALMIGTGSLFYTNLIWYGIILFIGMSILRQPDIREIIISLIGLFSPFLFILAVLYIFDYDTGIYISNVFDSMTGRVTDVAWTRIIVAGVIYILLMLLVAGAGLLKVFTTLKVKARKIFSLQIWIALITVPVYFLSPSSSGELLFIFAIPASYILTHFFLFRKGRKIVREVLFATFFLFVIAIQLLSGF